MDFNGVFLLVLLLFICLQLVDAVLLFKVCCKVILPATSVIAQLTFEGFMICVKVHVVPQSLPVSILMAAYFTLVRFCV